MNDFLISLQDVQNYLARIGYDVPTNINADNNLQYLREAAQERIKNYIGYNFLSASYTDERYKGTDSQIIYTRHRPITAINTVKIDGSEVDADFEIFQDGRAIFYDNGIFPASSDIKLSYQAGYTRTSMPADLRLAALKLCTLWFNLQNREGKTSESQENGASASFDPSEENILSGIYHHKAMVW